MADVRAYARFDVGYLQNPKIVALLHRPKAILLHVQSILYAAQHLTDGVVPVAPLTRMVGATKTDVNLLYEAGLWTAKAAGQAMVHDYLEHQRSAEQAQSASKAAKAAAQARWRANGNADGNADRIPKGNAKPVRREKEREISPLTPRAHAASLLGWEEEDERLTHLDTLFTEHNVRARHAWLTRCHETGDLEHLLAEQARAATPDDPWAHLPRITDADLDPPGGDPA